MPKAIFRGWIRVREIVKFVGSYLPLTCLPAEGTIAQPETTNAAMSEDRVQRRLAAILLADLVGYTRLTSRDEIGTLRRMQAVHREVVGPRIKGHDGRIVRMRGDDVLAEFP